MDSISSLLQNVSHLEIPKEYLPEVLILEFRDFVNSSCSGLEPWAIILYSVTITILVLFIVGAFGPLKGNDGNLQKFMKSIRKLPIIRQVVEKKMKKSAEVIEKQFQKGLENKVYLNKLPKSGWISEDILKEIEKYLNYSTFSWSDGHVSGTVYHGNDKKLKNLMTEVYNMTAYTNPLHPDVFPAIRLMEAEVVQMVGSMFSCEKVFGTVTSGGTESIFLACKAYRDYAKEEKRIISPNMVIPVTAHAAFEKAAHMLKIDVKLIPFDPKTTKVNVKKMKSAINGNTIMIVGSAPAFPHGSIDPIEEIAKLGVKYEVPVHVDCCLGGFLVPFMEKAGYKVPKCDFSVKGVTSISADTHKYAYAPKGSSIILYKEKIYRHYQYSVQPDWPGGIYGTPNLSGSRSGGAIATCWASLLFHGEKNYIESTEKIITVTKHIENGLREIPDIHVIGQPDVSVIAIGSKSFDIYRLSSALSEKGWNLNILQFPSGFHICITMQHTYEGVADNFLKDIQECTTEIMKNPKLPTEGTAAIYGMSQQIPDRSLVSELVWTYLDQCYDTK